MPTPTTLADMPHGAWIWRLAKIDPTYLDRLEAIGCKRVYLAEGNRNNRAVNGTRSMDNVAGIVRLREA